MNYTNEIENFRLLEAVVRASREYLKISPRDKYEFKRAGLDLAKAVDELDAFREFREVVFSAS